LKVATSTCDWGFARLSAFADSMRSADPRLNAFACSPFQRLAWYPLQAVPTAASPSSTVASPRTARRVRPWSSSPGHLARVAVGGEFIRQRREGRALAHGVRHAGARELLLHRFTEPGED